MPKYIAAIRRAPAGIIAQAHHTDLSPETWLQATGDWCSTEDEAVRTLLDDVVHEIRLAEGRIKRLYEKVERETKLLGDLRNFRLGFHRMEER